MVGCLPIWLMYRFLHWKPNFRLESFVTFDTFPISASFSSWVIFHKFSKLLAKSQMDSKLILWSGTSSASRGRSCMHSCQRNILTFLNHCFCFQSSVSRTPLKPQVQWRQDSTYVILTIAVNSDSNGFTTEVTKADDGRKDVLYFWYVMLFTSFWTTHSQNHVHIFRVPGSDSISKKSSFFNEVFWRPKKCLNPKDFGSWESV